MKTLFTFGFILLLAVVSGAQSASTKQRDCERTSERYAAASRNVSKFTNDKLGEEAQLADCLASGKKSSCSRHQSKIKSLESMIARESRVAEDAQRWLDKNCR